MYSSLMACSRVTISCSITLSITIIDVMTLSIEAFSAKTLRIPNKVGYTECAVCPIILSVALLKTVML